MAFVSDPHDPSGLGMYSKAGRFTSEKFIIFQKKDEILFDKKKVFKVSSFPSMSAAAAKETKKPEKNEVLEELKKDLANEAKDKKKGGKDAKANAEEVKANDLPEVKDKYPVIKNDNPSFGFYHPKYTLVHSRQPVLVSYKHEMAKTMPRLTAPPVERPIEEELMAPIVEKAGKKLVAPTTLDKQTHRPEFFGKADTGPHEARFEYFEYPKIFSKTQKIPSVNFQNIRGREFNSMYQNLEFAPDYNPNPEYVKRQLGSCGPAIKSAQGRKDQSKKPVSNNQGFFYLDDYKLMGNTILFKKTKTPQLKQMRPRDRDPKSVFPSFMQNTLHTRASLAQLNEKMLALNNYADGKFQTVTSGFNLAARKTGFTDAGEMDDDMEIDD